MTRLLRTRTLNVLPHLQYHIVPDAMLSIDELLALPYLDRLPTLMNKQPLLVGAGPGMAAAGCWQAEGLAAAENNLHHVSTANANATATSASHPSSHPHTQRPPLPHPCRCTASMGRSSWQPPAARLQTWWRSPWEGAALSCWRWPISWTPCSLPTPAGRCVEGLCCAAQCAGVCTVGNLLAVPN